MKNLLSCLLLLLLIPVTAGAGIDPIGESWVEMAYPGPETVSIMVVPDGSGTPFTAAELMFGNPVDATITLHLLDAMSQPVVGFPQEDMWLQSSDNGMVPCLGGTTAEATTDAAGITTWTSALRAGGYSQALCHVYVNGSVIIGSAGLAISFNSPDLNADGVVNLSDLPQFVADYNDPVLHYRSDLAYDGTINLSDIVKMAVAMGRSCP